MKDCFEERDARFACLFYNFDSQFWRSIYFSLSQQLNYFLIKFPILFEVVSPLFVPKKNLPDSLKFERKLRWDSKAYRLHTCFVNYDSLDFLLCLHCYLYNISESNVNWPVNPHAIYWSPLLSRLLSPLAFSSHFNSYRENDSSISTNSLFMVMLPSLWTFIQKRLMMWSACRNDGNNSKSFCWWATAL